MRKGAFEVPVKLGDLLLLQVPVVVVDLVGFPGADVTEVIRDDGHNDHVEHVVQEQGDGDGDQDQLAHGLRLLESLPAMLTVLVDRHAHDGQFKVRY